MGFFDDDSDDPFEEVVREFFGGAPSSRLNSRVRREEHVPGEQEERKSDFIETEKGVYFIFELNGYEENDVSVKVQGKELVIDANKTGCDMSSVQNYLSKKLCDGVIVRKMLPKNINVKSIKHTFKNGILEVRFGKK